MDLSQWRFPDGRRVQTVGDLQEVIRLANNMAKSGNGKPLLQNMTRGDRDRKRQFARQMLAIEEHILAILDIAKAGKPLTFGQEVLTICNINYFNDLPMGQQLAEMPIAALDGAGHLTFQLTGLVSIREEDGQERLQTISQLLDDIKQFAATIPHITALPDNTAKYELCRWVRWQSVIKHYPMVKADALVAAIKALPIDTDTTDLDD